MSSITSITSSNLHEGKSIIADPSETKGVVKLDLSKLTVLEWPMLGVVSIRESLYHTLKSKGCTDREIARFVRLYLTHQVVASNPKSNYLVGLDYEMRPISNKEIYTVENADSLLYLMRKISKNVASLFASLPTDQKDVDFEKRTDKLRRNGLNRTIEAQKKHYLEQKNKDQFVQSLSKELDELEAALKHESSIVYDKLEVSKLKQSSLHSIVLKTAQQIKEKKSIHVILNSIAKSYQNMSIDLFENLEGNFGQPRSDTVYRPEYCDNTSMSILLEGAKKMPHEVSTGVFHRFDKVNKTEMIAVRFLGKGLPLIRFLWLAEHLDRAEINGLFGPAQMKSVVIERKKYDEEVKNFIAHVYEEIRNDSRKDESAILHQLGKLLWCLAVTKPFEDGNNAITETLIIALAESKGLRIAGCEKETFAKALITPNPEDFAAKFHEYLIPIYRK